MGANGCQKLFGLIFLLITLILFGTLNKITKVFNANKALANFARYECTEASMQEIVGVDGVSGKCYSTLVDFEIRGHACSNNILTDSICGECISLEQTVQQWQHWTVEVCKNARTNQAREYNLSDPELSDQDKEDHAELARKKQCHTEDRYGWKNKLDDVKTWDFPSSELADRGKRGFFNAPPNLRLQDMDSTDNSHAAIFGGDETMFAQAKMGLAYIVAIIKTGSQPVSIYNGTLYSDANLEAARSEYEFCVGHQEALEFVGGITVNEFENLPDHGDVNHYPACDDELKAVGSYKVEAKCVGQPDEGVRVIGNIHKDSVTGETHFGPFTHMNYPDIDKFPVSLFVWEQDHTLTHDHAISNYVDDIGKIFKAVKNGLTFAMVITFLIAAACFKGNGGSSSSS